MVTKTEKLVEEFNKWADERIADYEFSPLCPIRNRARIDTLKSAKYNLTRIAGELNGSGS